MHLSRRMKTLQPDVDVGQFFAALRSAPARLLILDYDGTLAPFRVEREQAVPYPGVRELLTQLLAEGTTRVVLVSGRALESLVPLVAMDPAPEMWGSHGWERRTPDGRSMLKDPGPAARAGLRLAAEVTRSGRPAHWEVKPASLAVHVRGLAPEDERKLRALVSERWTAIAGEHGLELHEFDGGLELRVPGVNKGTAVDALLKECGAGVMAAYLGDDRTDEDAFRVIAGRGLGILVREELRPTAAAVWLRPPTELLDFFQRWIAACPRNPETAVPKSDW
jgi:trehalose 6-phosphate phosphatase